MVNLKHEIKKNIIFLIGAFLNAIALNWFLIPGEVYAGGFTGVAQLTASLIPAVSTGFALLMLNIPVAILGWMKIGKAFTFYSFLNVVETSFFLTIIPIQHLAPNDILLNAVFGGVIAAVGVGLTLKYGASTGGMDIIVMILSRMKDRPAGMYFFLLNSAIIVTAGYLFGWEKALYTLVSLYVMSRVIDTIHTRHEKLTAMIVTSKAKELEKAIHDKLVRGITTMPARGAYTAENKEVLMIVITRYELYDLKRIIDQTDPKAFTNIMETAGIYGFFRADK
ncbi:hypothetical protein CIB95_01285 [Lottiidibacillus patelloidae]|uniref:DUF2179 domain-containing protein n=1 Tax=Lottiidibacillus patelloidae TaxID=2670334 RepID=A0A263BWZ8_9BACI|nr:YitT family protein [Lottiidibacillus patelloidae]OZM58234.1 hypothetical protein CIB95_01285 [Lottiidibacillus patelloidae]